MTKQTWLAAAAVMAGVVACLALFGFRREDPTAPESAAPSPEAPARVAAAREDPRAAAQGKFPVESAAFLVAVRAPDGQPCSGASVAAYPAQPINRWSRILDGRFYPAEAAETPTTVATTGHDGWAALGGLSSGRWRIVVDAPRAARAELESAWVAPDPPREVTVALWPGNVLLITVRDAQGQPAAGVGIVVAVPGTRYGPAAWTKTWRTRTAADGTCRIESLPAGFLEVWATHEGSAPGAGISVLVPEIGHVDLVLEADAIVTGRVVDLEGRGVAGATVTIGRENWPHGIRCHARRVTGPNGGYRARARPAWPPIDRVLVDAPGFAPLYQVTAPLDLRTDDLHVLPDLVLRPEGRLEGKVTGPDGPAGGARVEVLTRRGDPHFAEMELAREVQTAADGTYAIGGLAAGTHLLRVHAKGLVQEGSDRYGGLGPGPGPFRESEFSNTPASALAQVAEGGTTTKDLHVVRTVTSALVRPTFAGVVRREDGTPVPWADTEAWAFVNDCYGHAGRTITARDGSFRLVAEAAIGAFSLYARVPGFRTMDPTTFDMQDSGLRSGLVIVVGARETVRGTVQSRLGLPVAGALVHAGTHHRGGSGESAFWDERPPVAVAADGTFALPLADRQPWGSSIDSQGEEIVVCVQAPGHGPAMSRQFTWSEAKGGVSVDLQLDAGAAIDGRVVDEAGHPLADAAITLGKKGRPWNCDAWPPAYPPMPDEAVFTRSDAQGRFRVEHLPAAAFEVQASIHGIVVASAEVTAPARGVELRVRESR